MIRVTESGMTFGPFEEQDLFRVEASPFVRRMNGIKACEFVYWNAQAGRLLFLEAKSSIPNPRKSPDEYRIYLVDILEKFDNSLQLLVAGVLRRTDELAGELGKGIAQTAWSRAAILFYLVIPDVPDEFLPGLTDTLRGIMSRQRTLWRADIFVINKRLARKKGLLAAPAK